MWVLPGERCESECTVVGMQLENMVITDMRGGTPIQKRISTFGTTKMHQRVHFWI